MKPFRHTQQERISIWAVRTLGIEACANSVERALRVAEEAIELAQACKVSKEQLHRLVDYVFERPAGKPGQEIAGTLVCLYSLASALGLDADREFEREFLRVNEPEVVDRIRRRQAEKRELLDKSESLVEKRESAASAHVEEEREK